MGRLSNETGEDWKRFEQTTAKIVAELAPFASVTWNEKLPGRQSGVRRQIDVTARWHDENMEQLLIVQARDRATPADVNDIGELSAVMRDVGASSGALVCSGGFAKSVHQYARTLGIELFGLHDAETIKWNRKLTVPLLWVDLEPSAVPRVGLWLDAGDELHLGPAGLPPLSLDNGKTVIRIAETFVRLWNQRAIAQSPEAVHTLGVEGPVTAHVITTDGKTIWREVRNFKVEYTVSRRAWLGQYEPASCRGLIDYLTGGVFLGSHIDLSDVPVVRDDSWIPIDDPDLVPLRIRGTLVTTEKIEIDARGLTYDPHEPLLLSGDDELEIIGLKDARRT